jgi:HlyD family secretion protein
MDARAWLSRAARPATWSRGARVAVAIAAVAAALAILAAARGREAPAYVAERRPIARRVVATGRVMPPARIKLGSVMLGRVAAVAVDEGDRVEAGQVVVRLDAADARAVLAQADARVAEARARLAQVRGVGSTSASEALRQAEVRAAQATRDLERARALHEGGSASRADLDAAERAFEVARSQAEAAGAQARSAGSGGADGRLAEASLAQAEGAREAARSRLADTEVRAPAAGLVVGRAVEPGDVVAAGQTLLVLARAGETLLTAQPDEKSLALVALGQPARAVADAFPDRPFDAVVSFIAPAVDPARGTFELRLRVPDAPPFLRTDMTVSVNVDVGGRADALVVPADAVRDPDGDPWVLAVDGGRTVRRAVRLGLRGQHVVEVTAGLSPGEAIVPASAASVAAGERVRVRRLAAPVEADRAL